MATVQRTARADRIYYGTMAAALVIGALQMARYRGGPLTSYGADVFGTIWLYVMFRQGRTALQRGRSMSPWAAAVFVFVGCAASELGQRIHLVPGTFDPMDVVAFAGSVALCWAVDTWAVSLA